MERDITCTQCETILSLDASINDNEGICPTCGHTIQIPPFKIGPGVTVGGFQIIQEIGRGAMGHVYLAWQPHWEQHVALKILPPSLSRDQESVARFRREVNLLQMIDHPNVVKALGAGDDDGYFYLAMSFVKGTNLDTIIRDHGALAEDEALACVYAIADALRYVWDNHSLLHRDVKPQNVMVDEEGNLHLMDLGLAKLTDGNATSQLTVPGHVLGTANFMSPEQAWDTYTPDHRSDIYSLGATLYMLVTGRPPYKGDPKAILAALRKPESFPEPKSVNPQISEECQKLIMKMMAPIPRRRYKTWDACIADIDRVLNHHQLATEETPSGRMVIKESGDEVQMKIIDNSPAAAPEPEQPVQTTSPEQALLAEDATGLEGCPTSTFKRLGALAKQFTGVKNLTPSTKSARSSTSSVKSIRMKTNSTVRELRTKASRNKFKLVFWTILITLGVIIVIWPQRSADLVLSFSKKVQTWIPEKTESDAKDEKKDDSKKETEVADKDKK